ncbi:hypothetical protein M0802_016617 [Mischocyttarus mexicanus]|nr:hypothetical protein M0802_016617 [Mischocyttarus mexicanus]
MFMRVMSFIFIFSRHFLVRGTCLSKDRKQGYNFRNWSSLFLSLKTLKENWMILAWEVFIPVTFDHISKERF